MKGNIPVSIESDAVSLKSDKAKRFFLRPSMYVYIKKAFTPIPEKPDL